MKSISSLFIFLIFSNSWIIRFLISSIFSIRFSNFFISDFNFSFSWFEKVKFKSCIVLCFWCSFKQKIHKFWLQFKQYEEKVFECLKQRQSYLLISIKVWFDIFIWLDKQELHKNFWHLQQNKKISFSWDLLHSPHFSKKIDFCLFLFIKSKRSIVPEWSWGHL